MFDRANSFLPVTATDLAKSLDILEERLFQLPVSMITKDPMTVSSALLDHLAWENSVDVWDTEWSDDIKRDVVAMSAEVHRFKGTPYALKLALSVFKVDCELLEWWQADGVAQGLPRGSFQLTAYARQSLFQDTHNRMDERMLRAMSALVQRVVPVSRKMYFRYGERFDVGVQQYSGQLSQRVNHGASLPIGRPALRAFSAGFSSGVSERSVSRLTHEFDGKTLVRSVAASIVAATLSTMTSISEHVFARRGAVGDVPLGDVSGSNLRALIMNVEQLAAFSWSPIAAGIGGARADYPLEIAVGEARQGPPYSSVKTSGFTVGQDISIETFLSAAANPDSVLYGIDLYQTAPSGRAYYGAVCSNFLSFGFGWPYSPTTSILSRDWRDWGFKEQITDFDFSDIEVGDVVVTDGGGHIELIVEKTHLGLTAFDQTFDGPDRQTWHRDDFMEYAGRRGYKLLKFDFGNADIQYSPNQFSPIRNEFSDFKKPDQILLLQRGVRSNYNPGETVRFNVLRPGTSTVVVQRDGVTVDRIQTAGSEIVSRTYLHEGDYVAFCEAAPDFRSDAQAFKIASVRGVASKKVVSSGSPVTVQFSSVNCRPVNLLVETISNNSISRGILRELTDDEIAQGSVTFHHDVAGKFNIRIRAVNEFGAVFSPNNAQTALNILQ